MSGRESRKRRHEEYDEPRSHNHEYSSFRDSRREKRQRRSISGDVHAPRISTEDVLPSSSDRKGEYLKGKALYTNKYRRATISDEGKETVSPSIRVIHVGEKDPKTGRYVESGYDAHFVFHALSNDWIGNYMSKRHYLFDKHNVVSTWKMLEQLEAAVVFDIGANIGTMTVPFSKVAKHVYSFEPQKPIVNLLRDNLRLNQCDNVVVEHCAVGHREMTAEMDHRYIVNDRLEEDSLSYHTHRSVNYGAARLGEGGEIVQMISVDVYCEQNHITRLDLMKVDVEGSEPLVFYGAKNTIRSMQPAILYERNYNTVTSSMRRVLQLDDDIGGFDVEKWCGECGYFAKIRLPKDNFLILNEDKWKMCDTSLFRPTDIVEDGLRCFDYLTPKW